MRIAIAGASGNVAQELFNALVGAEKYDVEQPKADLGRNVSWLQTDYADSSQLVEGLRGIHTVLCLITPQSDPGNASQKALIYAAVEAGVKRFAPSEWASAKFDHMPWYAGKAEVREYLAHINKHHKVIEYCLFQPGLFVNYFASPFKTATHLHPFQTHIDFHQRRAIVLEGSENARLGVITVQDFCNLMLRAIEYEGVWPVVGGVQGDLLTIGELIALGEKIRGPYQIDSVIVEDAMRGRVTSSWLPKVDHPAIPAAQVEQMSEGFTAGMLLALATGAFAVSDEWNRLLPNYGFTRAEDFLREVWEDKP